MRLSVIAILLVVVCRTSYAQAPVSDLIDTDSSFDVKYVQMDLQVRPDTEYIAGSVELQCVTHQLRADRTIQLSLRKSVPIDSLFVDGMTAIYTRDSDKFFVTLPHDYSPDTRFTVRVYYHGYTNIPDANGYIHTWQNWDRNTGIPIGWSWGEPYGSKIWWPCKDNPAVKLDSADLIFTCPAGFQVASNGKWISTTPHDTTVTYHWHESYPIDHYLIAFVCTKFDTIRYWHHWSDGDSTEMLHFVFPGSRDSVVHQVARVDTILDLYDRWFGPYPFRKEKYGIAQWHGGGMENQTLSFCNDWDSSLVAHETAHQWFGDGITCKDWNDVWLNEGFATYVTSLYFRYVDGQTVFDTIIVQNEREATMLPGNSVHLADSLLEQHDLDGRLEYTKASMVIHMLRYLLGDSTFFRAIREYQTGPLRYHTANADDFRASLEQSTGLDLKWFFDQWIYGEGFPIYTVVWNGGPTTNPAVAISQRGSEPYSPFFKMPVQLEFIGQAIDTTVQVWNDRPLQPYAFELSKPVEKVIFDPHNWLLDGEGPRTLGVSSNAASTSSLRVSYLGQAYAIDFDLAAAAHTTIDFVDVLGRTVATIQEGELGEGTHQMLLAPNALDAGVYFCRLKTNDAFEIAPFVVSQH